jgi:hypothetical protein
MLNFESPLTNEDPYADADHYTKVSIWYWAVGLVIGNLAGIPLSIVTYKTSYYFLSWIVTASIVVSGFYHLCQSTEQCFGYTLFQWVMADHVTATALMAYFLFFFFVSRSSKQITRSHILNEQQQQRNKKTTTTKKKDITYKLNSHRKVVVVDDSYKEIGEVDKDYEFSRDTVYENHIHEENMIYDAFTSFGAVSIFVFIVLQVIAHPFSYHAFINVLTYTLLLGLFKYTVIDEGRPKNLKGRLSWPVLLIGIFLALIGLTCYVFDSYVAYEILHTLWHIFIYGSLFFLFVSLILNTPYFYDYWEFICDTTLRCFR